LFGRWELIIGTLLTTYAEAPTSSDNPLHQSLSEHGLRTSGINTTIYKPLDEDAVYLVPRVCRFEWYLWFFIDACSILEIFGGRIMG